jgi:hypothetical protein
LAYHSLLILILVLVLVVRLLKLPSHAMELISRLRRLQQEHQVSSVHRVGWGEALWHLLGLWLSILWYAILRCLGMDDRAGSMIPTNPASRKKAVDVSNAPIAICRPDEEPRYRVHAIFQALAPLDDPIEARCHVVGECFLDARIYIDEVDRPRACIGRRENVAIRTPGYPERSQRAVNCQYR